MKKILVLFVFSYLFLVVAAQPEPVQNVGIGISNPTRAKLEVNGAIGATAAIFGGESTGISLQRNWPSIGFNQYNNGASKYISNGFAAAQYLDPTNGYMTIDMFPSGSANANAAFLNRALVIANNGNIGIRANAINASLFATKAGNFDGSAVFGSISNYSHFHYSSTEDTYIRPGKTGSNVYINDIPSGKVIIGSGNSFVGINSPNPVYPLEIRQTGNTGIILVEPAQTFNRWEHLVYLYPLNTVHSALYLLYNNSVKAYFSPFDGQINSISDRRLKNNIQPLPLVLDKIMQLRPVEYEMKYDNPAHEKTIGFIAQEVNKLFPEMVTVFSNTVTKGVTIDDFHALNYNAFKILAVKAVQEEQKLIDDLQNNHNEIIRRLEAIEKKLSIKK